MSCSRWHRLVALYVGDDLDRSRAERLERHLELCPSCRDLAQDLRRDLRRLRELDSAAAADPDLGSVRAAVMAKIQSRRTPPAVFVEPRLLAALAAVVVVVVLALLFREGREPAVSHIAVRENPSPAPVAAADPQPAVAFEAPQAADSRVARAEPSPREPVARTSPSAPVEPMTIKILTDDPEVVIYWIVDPKGDNEHV